ncbi:sulfur carrier protein ThiS [candidate division WOR-3 bacterium]|nr:sulfur carrier protein ThiS [candidate division WOR-3 bacterium]
MKIKLNKKDFSTDIKNPTVSYLLRQVAPIHPIAAVKVNGSFVKKTDYDILALKEGDNVTIVYMLGGG